MLDTLIKGAKIVDGTGAPAETGDLGIRDGRIVARGKVEESAQETVDADGLLATPGWVDVHTHYDGQVTWDDLVDPLDVEGRVPTDWHAGRDSNLRPPGSKPGARFRWRRRRSRGLVVERVAARKWWNLGPVAAHLLPTSKRNQQTRFCKYAK